MPEANPPRVLRGPRKPGEYLFDEGDITLNVDRDSASVVVRNTGDRPVQVGSHYHFYEVNRALDFDRAKAYGMRLDIPSGMAVRFEPGDAKEVQLVAFAGSREIFGHRGLAMAIRTDIRTMARSHTLTITDGSQDFPRQPAVPMSVHSAKIAIPASYPRGTHHVLSLPPCHRCDGLDFDVWQPPSRSLAAA